MSKLTRHDYRGEEAPGVEDRRKGGVQALNRGHGGTMTTTVDIDLTAPERRAVDRHRKHMCSDRGHRVSYDEALADWLENCAVAWREAWQRDYLTHQREEIMRHKWIESQKANRDLGSEAVMDWITKYAAAWREWYEDQADLPPVECLPSHHGS